MLALHERSAACRGEGVKAHRVACIGPNAVTQLAAALSSLEGDRVRDRVFVAAAQSHLLRTPPQHMIDEAVPQRLMRAVLQELPVERADRVLREAGLRTGDYILAHRIPALAQAVLKHVPKWIARRLLLLAISRHAWTFAGSGIVHCRYGSTLAMTIENNPLATPGCPWHQAVLERLFRELTGATCRVVGEPYDRQGSEHTRFVIVP